MVQINRGQAVLAVAAAVTGLCVVGLQQGGRSTALAGSAHAAPPVYHPTPDSVFYGEAAEHVLNLVAVARLNDDEAADVIFEQRTDGRMSYLGLYVAAGRATWPASGRASRLSPVEVKPPQARTDDSVRVIGVGDLNNDQRADVAAVRTEFPGGSRFSDEVYVYFGPSGTIGGGSYRTPGVTFDLPEPTAGLAMRFGDIDGDGRNEALLIDENSTRILRGRDSWPARTAVEPDIVFTPPLQEVVFGDLTGDGITDLVVNLDSDFADIGFLPGRSVWNDSYDLLAEADWTAGVGRDRFDARYAADLDGDGAVDLAVVDYDTTELLVYPGGSPIAGGAMPAGAAWSVSGIGFETGDVAMADVTADDIGDFLINRLAVFIGRPGRTGAYQSGTDDADAHWDSMPAGRTHSGDVDGDGTDDILFSEIGSAGLAREVSAGAIRLFRGPAIPPPDVSPTPRASVTPTSTATASATASPGISPTVTPGEGATIYLPSCAAGGT